MIFSVLPKWWGFVYFVLLVSRTRWGAAAAASMRDCDLRLRLVTSRVPRIPSAPPGHTRPAGQDASLNASTFTTLGNYAALPASAF